VLAPPYLPSVVAVIIPAHNEARVIGRLLEQLVSAARPGEMDVIVVANGCTDETAEVAASYGPPVRVLSIPVASKRQALLSGDRVASGFPRLYVDADVELGADDVRALDEALRHSGALAAGPQLTLGLAGRPLLVRWYYDVWARLPEVRRGLFGRGVIAVSEAGHARLARLPPLQADDLAASLAFRPDERILVPDARVLVHAPRTARDLLRRRIRVATGVAQITRTEGAPDSSARTRPADLLAIVRHDPRTAPRVVVFLATAVLARYGAHRASRRHDYETWLRDESSRSNGPGTS
jgi:glycosyltransferase involved in cell wall biosynthesis